MAENEGKKPDEVKPAEEGKANPNDEGTKVDYAKLKAERDKRKELEDKLAKIEADEAKKMQDQLLAEKKYQELLDQRNKEFDKINSELVSERANSKKSKIENAIIAESAKLKAKDPLDVVKFIDTTSIEFDDSGKIIDLEKILKQVKDSKPYLFEDGKAVVIPGENGRPANTTGNENAGSTSGAMSSNKGINSIMESLAKARKVN